MTKEPAPQVTVEGVTKGSSDLKVTLSMNGAPTAAAPPTAAPGGEVLVAGTASLGPGATATPGQTLFISVRDAASAGGPPLAADKLQGVTFPLSFEITSAHLMPMGGQRPVPENLLVSVRLDNDGNAFTKDGEPQGTVPSVKKGSTGVQVRLQ